MAHKRLLTVSAGDPAQLLALLTRRLPADEDAARRLIREGAVFLEGRRVQDPAAPLATGARLKVFLAQAPAAAPAPRVVHEDPQLLVVDKPAGLLSQPGPAGGASVLSWWQERAPAEPPPHLLHRLDREASGLLVLARDPALCAPLQRALAQRHLRRAYLALLHGCPAPAEGVVALRVARAAGRSHRRQALPAPDPAGQAAATRYRVLRRHDATQHSLVALVLGSGRTHQIRVHMAAQGHPIVGDREYGAADPPSTPLHLHAAALRFAHPSTGQVLSLWTTPPWLADAPVPADSLMDLLDSPFPEAN